MTEGLERCLVIVDSRRCNGCSDCANFCPVEVFDMSSGGDLNVVREGRGGRLHVGTFDMPNGGDG